MYLQGNNATGAQKDIELRASKPSIRPIRSHREISGSNATRLGDETQPSDLLRFTSAYRIDTNLTDIPSSQLSASSDEEVIVVQETLRRKLPAGWKINFNRATLEKRYYHAETNVFQHSFPKEGDEKDAIHKIPDTSAPLTSDDSLRSTQGEVL